MEITNIELSSQDLDTLGRIDATIRQRSLEITELLLKQRSLEAQVAELYNARNGLFQRKIESQKIDPNSVKDMGIDKGEGDTKVLRVIHESPKSDS